MIRRGLGGDRGTVVAEFAVALPAVMLVLLIGVGTLSACARQVRLQDAAADAARLASRGESDERVHAAVASSVGEATVTIQPRGDVVCVTASAAAIGALPFALSATSCALAGGL